MESKGIKHTCPRLGLRVEGLAACIRRSTGIAVALLFALTGCRTIAPLPPVNLGDPLWTVREGQAVWKRDANSPEIAGDLILATDPAGRAFVLKRLRPPWTTRTSTVKMILQTKERPPDFAPEMRTRQSW